MPTHADRWATFLDELDWWISQHGNADVPQRATSREVDGTPFRLGQRVMDRRREYRRGTLSTERVAELEQRTGWVWNARERRLRTPAARNIDALREYVANHGSLDGLEAAQPALARWLRNVRGAYRPTTDATSLPAARRADLAELRAIPGALDDRRGRRADEGGGA
jgi:hypothetical protein